MFDGTYPGYGSSYPDLQGGLGLLFEQASSRGHKQETAFGEINFPFTIRNQYTSSITTIRAAVDNKGYMRKYQQDFFKSAIIMPGKVKFRDIDLAMHMTKTEIRLLLISSYFTKLMFIRLEMALI